MHGFGALMIHSGVMVCSLQMVRGSYSARISAVYSAQVALFLLQGHPFRLAILSFHCLLRR